MEIEIPGGRVVERPNLSPLSDPAQIYAAHCLAAGYEIVVSGMGITEPSTPKMRVRLDGQVQVCEPWFMNLGGRGLVIDFSLATGETAYLYVREGRRVAPWKVATKVLVLPSDSPEIDGEDEDGAVSRHSGLVMQYVALVMRNNWFD